MLKNQKGFTLVEMLFVLLIISILMILIVPQLTSKSKDIQGQGCGALVTIVQTQVDLYYLNESTLPGSIDALKTADYITEAQTKCSNGIELTLTDGLVGVAEADPEQ